MRLCVQSLSWLVLCAVMGTAQANDEQILELLTGQDDRYRGTSSTATMTMEIKTARYERTVTMQSWTQGTERSLIRILAPARDQGVATLKVDDNIWNYLPRADRTIKVPPSMMSGNWMGSHITNDDLVQESRLSEDFTYTLRESPEQGDEHFVVVLVPKPDAPVVWGQIIATFRADKLPVNFTYHDEDNALVRTISYDNFQEVNGEMMPMDFTILPADSPDEYTRIRYDSLELNVDIPDSMFTRQALRQ